MLLERRSSMMGRFKRDGKDQSASAARQRPVDNGQVHHCGLRHRSTCESWSLVASVLWWLLRSGR